MEIKITCNVTDEHRDTHEIILTTDDIITLIKDKAEENGIRGYMGRLWRHLDERIIKVGVEW